MLHEINYYFLLHCSDDKLLSIQHKFQYFLAKPFVTSIPIIKFNIFKRN